MTVIPPSNNVTCGSREGVVRTLALTKNKRYAPSDAYGTQKLSQYTYERKSVEKF